MSRIFQFLTVAVIQLSLFSGANAFDLSQGRSHVTINLASYHLNASREFNEVNPGVGFGMAFQLGETNAELDLEAGFYRNSLGRGTYYVMSALDTEVVKLGDHSIRMGLFGGLAHYPGDAAKFKDRGVPTFGNWVMAAGAQVTYRMNDSYDLRLRAMPAGDVADALFTLQIAAFF